MRAIFSRIGCRISCDANALFASLICAALIGRRVFVCWALLVAIVHTLKRIAGRTVDVADNARIPEAPLVRTPPPDDSFQPPRGTARVELPDVSRLAAALRCALGENAAMANALAVTVLADGHAVLEGPPGLGKTLACRTLAATCGGTFSRIQCNADLTPAEITGCEIFDPRDLSFHVRFGPVCANVVLADEINRASPRAQAAFLEAMEERHLTVGAETRSLPRPFTLLATMNENEPDGIYPLPRAQLDRFLFKVVVPFPDLADELSIVERAERSDFAVTGPPIETHVVLEWQAAARNIYCAPRLKQHIVELVRATRAAADGGDLEYGAGPRASLALVAAARAHALLERRSFLVPSDVTAVAHDVIRHRIALAREFMLSREERERRLNVLLENVRFE